MSAKETRDAGSAPRSSALGRGLDTLMGDDGKRSEDAPRDESDRKPNAGTGASLEAAGAGRADAAAKNGLGPEGSDETAIYVYERSPCIAARAGCLIAAGAAGAIAISAFALLGVKAVLTMERGKRLF